MIQSLITPRTIGVLVGVSLMVEVTNQSLCAPISINNPSFEDPVMSPGGFNFGPITGWSVTGGGVWNPTGWDLGPVPDGAQVAYLNGGSVSQTLSATLVPNTTYVLSIEVGGRTSFPNPGVSYAVDLLVGGSTVASVVPVSPPLGSFTTLTATYSTGGVVPSGNLGISISTPLFQLDFDNVKLDASPTTTSVPDTGNVLAIAVLGLLTFGYFVRDREQMT